MIRRNGDNPPCWVDQEVVYTHGGVAGTHFCGERHGTSGHNVQHVLSCARYHQFDGTIWVEKTVYYRTDYLTYKDKGMLTKPDGQIVRFPPPGHNGRGYNQYLSDNMACLLQGQTQNGIWPGWFVRLTLRGVEAIANSQWEHMTDYQNELTSLAAAHIQYTECSPVEGWAFLPIDCQQEYRAAVDRAKEHIAVEKARMRKQITEYREAKSLAGENPDVFMGEKFWPAVLESLMPALAVELEQRPIDQFPYGYACPDDWTQCGLFWR